MGEILKSIRVEDDWMDKAAKRNKKTGESVDNPNRVTLVQVIAGLYAKDYMRKRKIMGFDFFHSKHFQKLE